MNNIMLLNDCIGNGGPDVADYGNCDAGGLLDALYGRYRPF